MYNEESEYGITAVIPMLQRLLKRRHNASGVIFVLYLVPILALTAYSMNLFSPDRSWVTLSLGLLFSALGTLALYSILIDWQQSARKRAHLLAEVHAVRHTSEQPETSQISVVEYEEKQNQMLEEINKLGEELERIQNENAQMNQVKIDLQDEYQKYKESKEDELENKKVLLSEYQETISEQRLVIEKKQTSIEELENKLKERDYELKTLLQLSDIGGDSQTEQAVEIVVPEEKEEEQAVSAQENHDTDVRTHEEASHLLKRSIDTAQKITGASHFSGDTPLFRDFQINNYALDLRRLFDSLRSENSSVVIVFSPKENRVLFVNQQIKPVLGWNPEKFIQDFFYLIEEGLDEWKTAVTPTNHEEHKVRLLLKSRSGQSKLFHCHLKAIPTGIFRGHIIGILYS